jgi:hypothetical protein
VVDLPRLKFMRNHLGSVLWTDWNPRTWLSQVGPRFRGQWFRFALSLVRYRWLRSVSGFAIPATT